MDEPENLLACPFCGAKPWHHLFGTTLVVGCANEKCVLHENTLGEHTQFTAENWNRRAGAPEHGVTQRSRLAPASWLDALADRWERRADELRRSSFKDGENVGKLLMLEWCLRELRAEKESASNMGDQP